jgi:hypothetical protein
VDWVDEADGVFGRPPERPTFGFTLAHGRGLVGVGAAARSFLDQFELANYMNTFHASLAPPASANGDGAAAETAPAAAGRST